PTGSRSFQTQISNAPSGFRAGAIALHRTERLTHTVLDALAMFESHNAPPTRHQVYQSPECDLYSLQILVDIGVIKFDRGENDRIWKVVQEFRDFIKESGIVLVAFENEVLDLSQLEAAADVRS